MEVNETVQNKMRRWLRMIYQSDGGNDKEIGITESSLSDGTTTDWTLDESSAQFNANTDATDDSDSALSSIKKNENKEYTRVTIGKYDPLLKDRRPMHITGRECDLLMRVKTLILQHIPKSNTSVSSVQQDRSGKVTVQFNKIDRKVTYVYALFTQEQQEEHYFVPITPPSFHGGAVVCVTLSFDAKYAYFVPYHSDHGLTRTAIGVDIETVESAASTVLADASDAETSDAATMHSITLYYITPEKTISKLVQTPIKSRVKEPVESIKQQLLAALDTATTLCISGSIDDVASQIHDEQNGAEWAVIIRCKKKEEFHENAITFNMTNLKEILRLLETINTIQTPTLEDARILLDVANCVTTLELTKLLQNIEKVKSLLAPISGTKTDTHIITQLNELHTAVKQQSRVFHKFLSCPSRPIAM